MLMRKKNLRKSAHKKVEYALRHEAEIRRLVRDAKLDSQPPDKAAGPPGGGGISDPTAAQAVRELTPVRAVVMHSGDTLYKPETWLRVVDSVYAQAAEYERAVAKYFFAGHSRIETQMKYNISERNVYYICDDIREAGVEIACQLGLVSVI